VNSVEQAPAGGIVAVFDACGKTRNPIEHEFFRADLEAPVWSDRCKFMAAYVM